MKSDDATAADLGGEFALAPPGLLLVSPPPADEEPEAADEEDDEEEDEEDEDEDLRAVWRLRGESCEPPAIECMTDAKEVGMPMVFTSTGLWNDGMVDRSISWFID